MSRFWWEVRYWTLIALMVAGVVVLAGYVRAEAQCGPGGCPVPQQPQWQAPAQTVPDRAPNPAVCRIRNSVGGGAAYLGTGVLVDVARGHGLVVSCAHTFKEGAGKVTCEFPGAGSFEATLTKDKDGHDLTALLIRDPGIAPVDVAETVVGVGVDVVSGGFGGDGRYIVRAGRIVQIDRNRIVVTGSARQGDSGGPILDRQGRLVGVLWGTGEGRTYGVAYTRADLFLTRAGRYLLPWNAEINDPARDPRNQPPAAPPMLPMPGQPPVDLGPIAGRLDAIEKRVGELTETEKKAKQLAEDFAKVNEDWGRALVAVQGQAVEAKAEAEKVKAEVADTLDEDNPRGLMGKLKARLEDKGMSATMAAVLSGLGVGGVGLIALLLVFKLVKRDVRQYVESGGEDKLAIQKLFGALPGDFGDSFADRLAERLAARYVRRHPDAAPPAAQAP